MLGNGITRAEVAKMELTKEKKTVISSAKLGEDITEQVKLIYSVAPEKFAKLAELQGYRIENINDAITLAENTKKDPYYFNFGKLFRVLKLTSQELAVARKNKVKIV